MELLENDRLDCLCDPGSELDGCNPFHPLECDLGNTLSGISLTWCEILLDFIAATPLFVDYAVESIHPVSDLKLDLSGDETFDRL